MTPLEGDTNGDRANLRYHKKSCWTCRFIRIRLPSSECLMLGRTMVSANDSTFHIDNNRTRVCDLWSHRPFKWNVYCDKNPHWEDVYYTREQLQRMKRRRGLT